MPRKPDFTKIRRAYLCIACLLCLAARLLSQTGAVQGTVTETLHSQPLGEVMISVQTPASTTGVRDSYTTVTDAQGRYHLTGLPAGQYTVYASKRGFIKASLPFTATGQTSTLDLHLTPSAVIAGRILAPQGEPVRNVSVQVLRYTYATGKRTLASVAPTEQSDDRGEYRIYGLRPGSYYLFAVYRDRSFVVPPTERIISTTRRTAFIPTYYPSAGDAAHAAAVQLSPGEEKTAVDIHLQVSPVYTIRMLVDDPASRFELQQAGPNTGLATAESLPGINFNGVWTAQNVPPGTYILTGTRQMPGNPKVASYAHQTITVTDRDVSLPPLPWANGFDISASIQVEGVPLSRNGTPLLAPVGPGVAIVAEAAKDGTFVFHNVLPRSYDLRYVLPPGSYLKHLILGDLEIPDMTLDFSAGPAPLLLVLASDGGRVEGSAAPGAVQLVLVPDGSPRNQQDTTVDETGHYSFPEVAPGTYHLYAFAGAEPGAPLDPDFRRPYQGQSVEVKVAPRGAVTVDVQPVQIHP